MRLRVGTKDNRGHEFRQGDLSDAYLRCQIQFIFYSVIQKKI